MERKVLRYGDNLDAAMADAFKKLGFEAGDIIEMEVHSDSREMIIKRSNKTVKPEGISDDFVENLSEIFENFDETIKGLKDR